MSVSRIVNFRILIILLSLVAVGSTNTFTQTKKPMLRKKTTTRTVVRKPAVPVYTITAGTRLHARINETVNSKTARVGERFTATVTDPVYSSTGALVIPNGSTLTGRVDTVQPARKGGKPGAIDFSFISLRLPNGKTRVINGTLTDLTSDDAKSDAEGTARGDKMKHRKMIFYGGGTAGGAILGAAIGGGKGALIGGLLGAGGGFLGERYTKGDEAEVRNGTEFGVYLNQPISMPKYTEVTP